MNTQFLPSVLYKHVAAWTATTAICRLWMQKEQLVLIVRKYYITARFIRDCVSLCNAVAILKIVVISYEFFICSLQGCFTGKYECSGISDATIGLYGYQSLRNHNGRVLYIFISSKQLRTHGCVLSIVANDALVLKHQAITIHSVTKC